MKMLALMVAAAATLAGCSTQPARQGCGPGAPEQFDAFLPRYMTDRQFATARTVFPLELLDTVDETKELLSREEFAQSTLLADVIKADKLSTSQVSGPGVVELNVFRPDADSHIYYYRFRLQNGCWHLWQFEDASL